MPRLLLALLLAAAIPGAAAPADAPAEAVLDELLVSGDQPGPGLWQVTHGENKLWILGTLTPLPRKMHWRSARVEDVIAQSQALLGPPGVSAGSDIGFFRGMRLLPSLLRARANPDGAVLADVLSPDLHARWLRLKQRYIGRNDKMERWRPMFAAFELYEHVLRDAGLTQQNVVSPVIKRASKRHRLAVIDTEVEVRIEDPKKLIADFSATSTAADIACLQETMDVIENDLETMRLRANAWATGDIESLRVSSVADRRICIFAATSAPTIHEKFEASRAATETRWLEAAEKALNTNRSTFAVLPIRQVLAADGLVARLRAKGYQVIEP